MNSQQRQVSGYRSIAGAVQIPLVMLVWGALVLFFGHQYQANALLPSDDRLPAVAALEADELLVAQQRNERLLARLALQTPVPVPSLLDSEAFAADLAAQLSLHEAKNNTQKEKQKVKRDENRNEVNQPAKQHSPKVTKPKVASTREKAPVASVVKPQRKARVQKARVQKANAKPAKFVRLPAVVQRKATMRVDALRALKDSARADLRVGRSKVAYQRLRGQVSRGRTDIEFLGLLALASLPQQPQEAQVLYQHLILLQPDAQRWKQGLAQSQRLIAAQSGAPFPVTTPAAPKTTTVPAVKIQAPGLTG